MGRIMPVDESQIVESLGEEVEEFVDSSLQIAVENEGYVNPAVLLFDKESVQWVPIIGEKEDVFFALYVLDRVARETNKNIVFVTAVYIKLMDNVEDAEEWMAGKKRPSQDPDSLDALFAVARIDGQCYVRTIVFKIHESNRVEIIDDTKWMMVKKGEVGGVYGEILCG